MSSQVDRNQEIWDQITYLSRKVLEMEHLMNQWYEQQYEEDPLE